MSLARTVGVIRINRHCIGRRAVSGSELARLPFPLRIPSENAIHCIRADDAAAILDWPKSDGHGSSVALMPRRTLMHDTTAVSDVWVFSLPPVGASALAGRRMDRGAAPLGAGHDGALVHVAVLRPDPPDGPATQAQELGQNNRHGSAGTHDPAQTCSTSISRNDL